MHKRPWSVHSHMAIVLCVLWLQGHLMQAFPFMSFLSSKDSFSIKQRVFAMHGSKHSYRKLLTHAMDQTLQVITNQSHISFTCNHLECIYCFTTLHWKSCYLNSSEKEWDRDIYCCLLLVGHREYEMMRNLPVLFYV